MLSKNFISLLENMKSSYNEIDEDREEKKRDRREDKFGVSTNSTDGITKEIEGNSDFKIRPFSRAVQQLKSQVQSEIFNIDQTIDNRGSGSQSASKYKQKFNTIMEIISKITSKLDLIKDKGEKNLDDKDIDDIKIFRGLYNTASNDFLLAQKEWSGKKLEDENKYLSDLKDTDTNNLLINADKSFAEAQSMLNGLIKNSQTSTNNKKTDNKESVNIESTDIIKGGSTYSSDSKEGKIVIEVKKAIYAKFKKYLEKTEDWKVVYKSYPNVSGSLLKNTQSVIKGVKAGLVDDYPELSSDKTGDITPLFIAAINKVSESEKNTTGKLITFENFIKSKINEDFNQAAAENAMKPQEFKKKDSYKKETDKKDTDKKDTDKKEDIKKDKNKEFSGDEAKKIALKGDYLLKLANKKIQSFYKNESNFTEFKNKGLLNANDNEDEAVEYIFGSSYNDKNSWFYKNIRRKFTKPVFDIIKELKKSGDKYEEYYLHLGTGIKKVSGLYGILKKKTYGSSYDDDHKWSYTNLDGEKSNYKVDTDF